MTQAAQHPFETGLDRVGANYVALTPVSFLTRAAKAFGNKTAVIDGDRRYTYRQLLERCNRLASALRRRGVRRLDTVAIIASNIPEMIEAHFAIPMLGAGTKAVVANANAAIPLKGPAPASGVVVTMPNNRPTICTADAERPWP